MDNNLEHVLGKEPGTTKDPLPLHLAPSRKLTEVIVEMVFRSAIYENL